MLIFISEIFFQVTGTHPFSFLFVCFLFYLFIFGCVGSSLLRAGFLQLCRRASHCSGFSCCAARAPGVQASVVVVHGLSSCGLRALERRLSSCSARAQLLCSMWDLPGPGLEPVSSSSAGGFLTAAPPGKPHPFSFDVGIFLTQGANRRFSVSHQDSYYLQSKVSTFYLFLQLSQLILALCSSPYILFFSTFKYIF